MFNKQIVKDKFGIPFQFDFSGKEFATGSHAFIQFASSTFAEQFLSRFDQTRLAFKLARGLPTSSRYSQNAHSIKSRLAKLLVSRKWYVYQVSNEISLGNAITVGSKSNKNTSFVPIKTAIKLGTQPSKRFGNFNEALQAASLLLNAETDVLRIFTSLDLIAPSNASESQKALAQALLDGKVAVIETVTSSARANQAKPLEVEPASTVDKAISTPPAADKKPSSTNTQTTKNADADQAQALIEAAENGTPFCEECA